MADRIFGTDRPLLYDVAPWNELGFGCPNFGNNIGTINTPVNNLVDEMGQIQLSIMTHVDARRNQPPSVNTIKRLGKVLNRVVAVLTTRMRDTNENLLEPLHSQPSQKIWMIHPVPYFNGPSVVNNWLREYNELVMIALCNMMQHSDNNRSLTITKTFATQIYQYFREIKLLLGSELLDIPLTELKADDFVFTDEHYNNYFPEKKVVDTEALNEAGNIWTAWTEDDLQPLARGYPANMIAPLLKEYPIGPIPGLQGIGGENLLGPEVSAPGTEGKGPAIGDVTI